MDHSPAHSRALEVVRRLHATYPDAHTSLDHTSAFELLVATVLSAQTTDARVNTVTPELFRRWPDPVALAGADPGTVEAVVRPLGFQHRRAGQVVALAGALVADFQGDVPADARSLESLPGVGRKTANVVRGNWFGEPALTVDTHVGRLARRLGWTRATDPARVERDVCALLPGIDWTQLSHEMIWHGREACHSRTPDCAHCVLADLCPSAGALS
ncbi:MAG: endonuclease III [Pauljensenia sp.]